MRKAPERFLAFKKKYPNIADAYERFAGECHHAGPLSDRERTLAKLGIAVGSHTEGSVVSQVRKALDIGITPDEIRHVILLAATAIGFPRMMAAMNWADDIIDNVRE
jgi:4-carboxymuconolactone decarboxylase